MIHKLLLNILLLFSSRYLVFSLKCYDRPNPFILNYSVTISTLPSFDDNLLIDVSGECTFTIIWFRNPASSMIVFGYNSISNEISLPIDSLLASVQYRLEGEESLKRLSRNVQYKCQSSDGCNSGTSLKRVLTALRLEEHFSDRFDSLIATNQSFDNQSINECYFYQNSTKQCPTIDYLNCRRCEISMDFSHSSNNEICATCPTVTEDFNSIMRDAIFTINNRSQVVDRVQLSCQTAKDCNSIENIYQIRQASSISFDFDIFFPSSSSSSMFFSMTLQMIIFCIKFIFN